MTILKIHDIIAEEVMNVQKIIFKGGCKPAVAWKEALAGYDGSPAMVVNESDMTHDGMTQALKRYLWYWPYECRVVSRKGVLYLNLPLKECQRVPSVLYYEGDWEKLLSGAVRRCQQVVNLTNDYKNNCDFVKQLNRAIDLYAYGSDLEARSQRGRCILATVDYWDEVSADG